MCIRDRVEAGGPRENRALSADFRARGVVSSSSTRDRIDPEVSSAPWATLASRNEVKAASRGVLMGAPGFDGVQDFDDEGAGEDRDPQRGEVGDAVVEAEGIQGDEH